MTAQALGPSEALPDAPTTAIEAIATPSGDVDCGHCGCWFTSMDAYDLHRRDGKCHRPTDCGLVVSPRIRLTWSIPIKVPTAYDMFGNPTEWAECDPEVAGQWDPRCWSDHA